MKIIISESQYNLLLESNFEKNKRLVGKMWDEGMKIGEITELIGLNEEQVILLLKDKPIKIDCGFAERITTSLFWKTDFIRKDYSFDDGETTLEFTWGGFSGIIYFTYEDEDYEITGMATPFWNGDCSIPVDLDRIKNKSIGGEYQEDFGSSDIVLENTPYRFNSIQELIDFLNTDYPKEILKVIPKLISKYS
jgi:hypothetical protein